MVPGGSRAVVWTGALGGGDDSSSGDFDSPNDEKAGPGSIGGTDSPARGKRQLVDGTGGKTSPTAHIHLWSHDFSGEGRS